MSTDAPAMLAKLKTLRSKLPATAPQYLQKDYAAFLKKADFFMTVTKRFADDGPSAKDLADFKARQQDLAKLKEQIAKLKDQINSAVKEQQSDLNDLHQVERDVLKMQNDLQDTLKGKKAKEETDLSKALSNFGVAAEEAGGLEAATAVAD
jgi:hypothetical protein